MTSTVTLRTMLQAWEDRYNYNVGTGGYSYKTPQLNSSGQKTGKTITEWATNPFNTNSAGFLFRELQKKYSTLTSAQLAVLKTVGITSASDFTWTNFSKLTLAQYNSLLSTKLNLSNGNNSLDAASATKYLKNNLGVSLFGYRTSADVLFTGLSADNASKDVEKKVFATNPPQNTTSVGKLSISTVNK